MCIIFTLFYLVISSGVLFCYNYCGGKLTNVSIMHIECVSCNPSEADCDGCGSDGCGSPRGVAVEGGCKSCETQVRYIKMDSDQSPAAGLSLSKPEPVKLLIFTSFFADELSLRTLARDTFGADHNFLFWGRYAPLDGDRFIVYGSLLI